VATASESTGAQLALSYLKMLCHQNERAHPGLCFFARTNQNPICNVKITMKIVVIGGTGFIGKKLVANLSESGHQVIIGAPSNHIDSITAEGLAEALAGSAVVVDVTNPRSYDDGAIMEFFEQSGRNLAAAERLAAVQHHVVLSIVGADAMSNIGYMRGKVVQEEVVKGSGMPYTIVRSTQFFEFLAGIADLATQGTEVQLSAAQFQPIAAVEVVSFLTQFALAPAINGTVDIAGPERSTLFGMVGRYLEHTHDPRKLVLANEFTYYGQPIGETALVPAGPAKVGAIPFDEWIA
jgi:uncharacterized protein YbjT (DUF2867 family)